MTEEEISIAKRLIQSPNWKWMPGMRWWTNDDHGRLDDFQPEYMGRPINSLPDLRDPGTLGCIHHLIRRLWATKETKTRPIPVVNISECDGKWEVGYRYGEVRVSIFFSDLEIEAIAWALENGP
jgi:hypothetical protein